MRSDTLLAIVVAIGLIVLIGAALWVWGPWGCEARWDGFDSQWTLQGGCKVLTESGYVPEGSFRVVATP